MAADAKSSEEATMSSESVDLARSLLKTHADIEQFCFDGGSLSCSASPIVTPRSSKNAIGTALNSAAVLDLPELRFEPIDPVVDVAGQHDEQRDEPIESEPTTKKRKLDGSSRMSKTSPIKTKQDVSVHARKACWVAMYGESRLAKCCVCQFNEVGWTNVGFDMAHVVPRSLDGNNRDGWNRVPTCGTCNGNVASNTNLLDFIVQHYPHRLIPVVCFLYGLFVDKQPYLANKYFKKNGIVRLEMFVRTLYGTNGLESDYVTSPTSPAQKSDNSPKGNDRGRKENSLVHFLRRALPDFATKRGRVKDDHVYAILRHYDSQVCEKAQAKAEMQDLDRDIDALQSTIDRLRRIKKDKADALARCRREIKRLQTA